MKTIPTFILHVWHLQNGQLAWEEITDRTVNQCHKWWDYKYRVGGKAATVFCFFSDYDIEDWELRKAATCFVMGQSTNYYIDLRDGEITKTTVFGKLHPRQ